MVLIRSALFKIYRSYMAFVCPRQYHFQSLGHLEGSAGSFADLVQFVLQGIELSLHFFEGCALRRDEETSVLART
jgi:hypothetical protein